MIDYIPVKFPGDAPYRLADLNGVHTDLRSVAGVCALIQKKLKAGPASRRLREADWMQEAAIVRYARCFSGGRRTAFIVPPEWIERLPAPLRAAHERFIALRDKHIAHSVNDWEINLPVIYLKHDSDAGSYEVDQVQVQHHRVVSVAEDEIEVLRELAITLSAMAESEIEVERARLLEAAKAIPIEELKARIADPGTYPGQRGVRVARGR